MVVNVQHIHLILYLLVFVLFYEELCKQKINIGSEDSRYLKAKNLETTASDALFSSAWCRGSNHTNRVCRFKNLCYRPKTKDFIFLHSFNSVVSGIPSMRFNPTLIDFSSVEDHNKQYFNYIDLPAEYLAKYDVSFIEGFVLIFKRFNPENLMHVFHDDLLPAFFTIKEIFPLNFQNTCLQIILAFADDRPPGPYSFLYEHFCHNKPLFLANFDINKLYCFKDSYVGLNKYTTWYQYGFKQPQGPLAKDFRGMANVMHEFCHYFKKQFNISLENDEQYAVLLSRKNNRKILNEKEVASAVKNATSLKVMVVALESQTVLEAIKIISRCQVLVGMHGSLLILSIFLSPGSAVVELFPYAISAEFYTPFKTLCSFLGLLYRSWENKLKSNTVPHPENKAEYGGIYHLTADQQKIIVENSLIAPHLCCYNPEWLYHIYQDTVVDINSFFTIVQNVFVQHHKFTIKDFHTLRTETITNHLLPGEVKNLTCLTSVNENEELTLNLTWAAPWNLEFLHYTTTEYEVWFQLSGTENIQAYLMKETNFIVTKSDTSLYYVWVRCHIDYRTGPFNSNPMVCFNDD